MKPKRTYYKLPRWLACIAGIWCMNDISIGDINLYGTLVYEEESLPSIHSQYRYAAPHPGAPVSRN